MSAAELGLPTPPTDDEREAARVFAEGVGWVWESLAPMWQERFKQAARAVLARPHGTVADKPADEPRVQSIVAEIVSERGRQDAKWGAPHDVADGTGPGKRMLGHTFEHLRDEVQTWVDRAAEYGTSTMSTVLLEEVFEALAESDEQKLRAELIQVAAVAAKWVQIIDAREVE